MIRGKINSNIETAQKVSKIGDILFWKLLDNTFFAIEVFSQAVSVYYWVEAKTASSFLTQFQNQLYKSNATYILMLHESLTSQTFRVFFRFFNQT